MISNILDSLRFEKSVRHARVEVYGSERTMRTGACSWIAFCCAAAVLGCGSSAQDVETPPDDPTPMTCLGSQTLCDAQCVDLCCDDSHCGVCGRACEAGLVCEAGQCMTPAEACELEGSMGEATLCEGECVDVDTSVAHCGGCGIACPAGEACVDGSCLGPPPFDECEARVTGTLQSTVSDIPLAEATVVSASLRHAFDVDEVESQGCVDRLEMQVLLNEPGCTLTLVFAADEAGAGLVYAGLDADSFCPGFEEAQEGFYERADGWAPVWFGLDKVANGSATQTCVAGKELGLDGAPLRLLRDDGAELTVDLSEVSVGGWVPSEQDVSAACVPGPACGQARDGGDGWCVLEGCSPDYHDGGDETCLPEGQCTEGYAIHRSICSDSHSEVVMEGRRADFTNPSIMVTEPCTPSEGCLTHLSLLYREQIDRRLRYGRETDDGWHFEDSDFVVSLDYSSRIAHDATTGHPEVCFRSVIDLLESELLHARWTPDGWTDDVRHTAEQYSGCATVVGDRTQIASIAVEEGVRGIGVAAETEEGWVIDRYEDGDPPDQGRSQPSATLSADEVLHMSYAATRDVPSGVEYLLRYARIDSDGVDAMVVIDEGRPGASSVAVDPGGVIYIAYWDRDAETVNVARGNNGIWDLDILPRRRVEPGAPAIALDENSKIHMAYVSEGNVVYAYQVSRNGEPLRWDFVEVGNPQGATPAAVSVALALDRHGHAHIDYVENVRGRDESRLRYVIIARVRRCVEGTHNGGDGACVPLDACSEGFRDGGLTLCVPDGQCSPGFADGGDGAVCLPVGTCLPGYHDGGFRTCVPLGECIEGFSDPGDGTCVEDP